MDEKILATDFLVKSANLCDFLITEKNEKLISANLMDASEKFSKAVYSFSNPLLSKAEVSALKKTASLEADAFSLNLSALFSMGLISSAQRDSMTNSLSSIKKQMNI